MGFFTGRGFLSMVNVSFHEFFKNFFGRLFLTPITVHKQENKNTCNIICKVEGHISNDGMCLHIIVHCGIGETKTTTVLINMAIHKINCHCQQNQ